MDTSHISTATPGRSRKVVLWLGGALVVAAAVAAAYWLMTRPSQDDFASAKTTTLKDVAESQSKIAPAVDAYFAAFRRHEKESGSLEQAKQGASSEYDLYKKAIQQARDELDKLATMPATRDGDVRRATKQLVAEYEARLQYVTSLVDSYADYVGLFGGRDNTVCLDIFIGETSSAADRKNRLAAAAGDCYEAANRLAASGNASYERYAKKLVHDIKQLEDFAQRVTQSEAQYAEFKKKQAELTARAETLGGNNDDTRKLMNEIKETTLQIDESTEAIGMTSDRYGALVKAMPAEYEAIFSKNVPKKLDSFKKLVDIRREALNLTLERKAAES